MSDGHLSCVIVVQRLGDEHRGLVAVNAKGNAVGSAVGQGVAGGGAGAEDESILSGGFDIVADRHAAHTGRERSVAQCSASGLCGLAVVAESKTVASRGLRTVTTGKGVVA